MIRHMVAVSIFIWMAQNMMVNGLKINNMDTVSKFGLMVQDMKETMIWERNKEKVILNGLTEVLILEIFQITIFMVMECMNGQMEENIKVNGEIIRCMGKENSLGQMEENILEIT